MDTAARQDAPTADGICLLVQQKMGWHNGADFEEDRCGCDQCHAKREEARKIVASIVELSHASLKSRLKLAEGAVDVLESNARVQAKLLADTGRRAEALTEALQFIADGYENHDVNHVDYRVKVYQVALEALEAKP